MPLILQIIQNNIDDPKQLVALFDPNALPEELRKNTFQILEYVIGLQAFDWLQELIQLGIKPSSNLDLAQQEELLQQAQEELDDSAGDDQNAQEFFSLLSSLLALEEIPTNPIGNADDSLLDPSETEQNNPSHIKQTDIAGQFEAPKHQSSIEDTSFLTSSVETTRSPSPEPRSPKPESAEQRPESPSHHSKGNHPMNHVEATVLSERSTSPNHESFITPPEAAPSETAGAETVQSTIASAAVVENAQPTPEVAAGEDAQQTPEVAAGEDAQQTPEVAAGEDAQQTPEVAAGEDAQQTPEVAAGKNAQPTPEVAAGEDAKSTTKNIPTHKPSFQEKLKNFFSAIYNLCAKLTNGFTNKIGEMLNFLKNIFRSILQKCSNALGCVSTGFSKKSVKQKQA